MDGDPTNDEANGTQFEHSCKSDNSAEVGRKMHYTDNINEGPLSSCVLEEI